jgi:hypothetical protein
MRILNEAGLPDRDLLIQEIEAIFEENGDGAGQECAWNGPALGMVKDHVDALIRAGQRGEVRQAAEHVIALLTLDLDDLRKAALLSLIVRQTGKRKFDPVAAYVLEKRATYVTGQG